MKKVIGLLAMMTLMFNAKPVGVSMSYYFPTGGYFASPVAPLAIKDLGLKFGKYVQLSGSFVLYNIGGMRGDGFGFHVPKPILGSFLSFNTSANLAILFPYGNFEWKAYGGPMAFKNFSTKVLESNLESAMIDAGMYETVNTRSNITNKWGSGFQVGGKITYFLKKDLGISISGTYVKGRSDLGLSGSYDAYDAANGKTSGEYNYSNSQLIYDGLEFSLGVTITK